MNLRCDAMQCILGNVLPPFLVSVEEEMVSLFSKEADNRDKDRGQGFRTNLVFQIISMKQMTVWRSD